MDGTKGDTAKTSVKDTQTRSESQAQPHLQTQAQARVPSPPQTQLASRPQQTQGRSAGSTGLIPATSSTASATAATDELIVRLPGQLESSAISPRVGRSLPLQQGTQGTQGTGQGGLFDDTLARIQAAMAAARMPAVSVPTPAPADPSSEVDDATVKSPVKPTPPKSAIPEYFEVTQIDPPRSPPPAWRSYTVRIPKGTHRSAPISNDPPSTSLNREPKGWSQSFEPALESLDVTNILVPRPLATRVMTGVNAQGERMVKGLIEVCIPTRKFERVQKKKNKSGLGNGGGGVGKQIGQMMASGSGSGTGGKRDEVMLPSAADTDYGSLGPLAPPVKVVLEGKDKGEGVSASASAPLAVAQTPGAATQSLLQQASNSRTRPSNATPTPASASTSNTSAETGPNSKFAPSSSTAEATARWSEKGVKDGQVQNRSHVQAPATGGRKAMMGNEAVVMPPGTIAERRGERVRFMVSSSELEGDSLLDEVNKMSLETVGEGMGDEGESEGVLIKTPGSEVSWVC